MVGSDARRAGSGELKMEGGVFFLRICTFFRAD